MDEAQLFTVRVWWHAQQFRAAVRAVGEERTELFSEPAQVADFLWRCCAEGPAPAPAQLAGDGGVHRPTANAVNCPNGACCDTSMQRPPCPSPSPSLPTAVNSSTR